MISAVLYALLLVIMAYDSYYFAIFLYQSFKKITIVYSPPVSVIIPVYNNETTIKKCIQSVLNSHYDIKEIIVVNDGSTDKTRKILDSIPGITVYDIPHSGKAAALNYGITHSSGDIVTLDADTIVNPDTIQVLVRNLKVYSAVAGNVQVLNPKSFLGRAQAIEHVRVAMFRKVAQYFNDIDIVPGPIGAFSREIFSKITYGTSIVEDMELTHHLRDKGFTIGYEQNALAYTEMPVNWTSFLRQRLRWMKGNLELLVKKQIPVKKVLTGLVLAFLDIFFVVFCLVHHYYTLILLLFIFESMTMIVGNHKEKTHLFVESVFFPVFMLFFDVIFLFSYSVAGIYLFKEFLSTLLQKNTHRT
ncbi:MAG: glycosyltransferase [Candidatus Methanofastidiosia archaeon]|jgi:cellulose synthase/poly-beta-1,6-N-acetylglucosamine synthase-like glycosyltransferase